MYYIYHIPGVKIGCTTQPEKRIKAQGYTNYEILEEHEDGWLAGDRERVLQAEYGYKVDNSHYMISRQNWAEAGRKNVKSGHLASIRTKEYQSKGGRKNVESGHISNLGKKSQRVERTCPHCQKTIKGSIYFRWHDDNCKKKLA